MCERCDVLAAENARLRDELAEWRRQRREEASVVVEGEAFGRWVEALRLPPLLVRGLILLAERADRLVGAETLARACSRDFDGLVYPGVSAKVAAHKIRRALAAAGVAGKIETVWGVGYRMPSATAAELRRRVFGPDAITFVEAAAHDA